MNTLWLVLAISLPSVLVAVVLAVLLVKRKAQDRLAVERLLAAVKNAEPDYRQAMLNRLLKAGVAEERAQADAGKLVKHRRQYWKQLLAALLNREPAALLQAEPALRQFSEAHLQDLPSLVLAIGAAPAVAAATESVAADAAGAADGPVNETMRRENDRLKREVGLTLSALNNIFAEYASMFGDEQTRRDMNLEEILTAMQQLAAGQPAESTAVDAGGNRPLAAATDPGLAGLDEDFAGDRETDPSLAASEPSETETLAPDAANESDSAKP